MKHLKRFIHGKPGLITLLFLSVICLSHVLLADPAATEATGETAGIKTVVSETTGTEAIDTESAGPTDPAYDREEIERVMNLNLRYILNTWWHSEKDFVYAESSNMKSDQQLTEERSLAIKESAKAFANWRDEDLLPILYLSRDSAENGIRPISHAIYCIALALYYDYYDEEIVGVSKEDAQAMCIKLIRSVVAEHRSNYSEEDDEHWGDSWQSPLWAENIGLGAMLLKDSMDPEDYAKVELMVIDEADTLTYDFEIPYYMDESGKIIYPGDTKGEEIAWAAKVIALACAMFPDSEKCSDWNDKLERMLVSATAMPEDVGSDRIVDGQKVGDMINGSNVNEDGTVVNHDLVHLDYMATILEEMGDTITIYTIEGMPMPEAAAFNLEKIYEALIYVDLGKYDESKAGLNFYLRDKETGQPTGDVTMPGENDWGSPSYPIYFLSDVIMETLGPDAEIEEAYKAAVWAALHYDKLLSMVNRETDGEITGQYYQPGENYFVSGELFMDHNLAEAYVLLYS